MLFAQPTVRQLRLQEVIEMAQEQSAVARQVETKRETSYWQWRSFKAGYKPQLSIEGILPDFSRTINPVTQPDGTLEFQPVSNNYSEVGLTLAQAQATLDAQTALLALKTYVGLRDSLEIQLVVPEHIPTADVQTAVALSEAFKNRKENLNFQRRLLEAESGVAKAKGDNGFNASVYATFGLTNRGENWRDIYRQPENQQGVQIGFSMPLLDWGRQRANYKVAALDRKLVQHTVAQEEASFEQAVITQVNQYNMLRNRIKVTAEAADIAQERYDIAKSIYLIGRISITDLGIALTEKDQARRAYIASLSEFWEAFYNLRQLTLYDFKKQEVLLSKKDEE
ncbi:hypothetical protein GCM10027443_25870 [Pontibacter brevis]